RYEDINAFKRYLSRNGVVVRKFFLHVSPEEQRQRFLDRLDEPAKNWKFSLADVRERGHWGDYMRAYEAMIRHTSTPHPPWHVVCGARQPQAVRPAGRGGGHAGHAHVPPARVSHRRARPAEGARGRTRDPRERDGARDHSARGAAARIGIDVLAASLPEEE